MQKLEELLNIFRKNKHLLDLNIKDHIHELFEKDSYMKAIDEPKIESSKLRQAYIKESLDLYILLKAKFDTDEYKELFENRVLNIINKIEKNN